MARLIVKLSSIFLVVILSTGCSAADRRDSRSKLDNVKSWTYLIQDQSKDENFNNLRRSGYDLVVIDQTRSLKGEEKFDSRAEVDSIKKSGDSSGEKIVLCYLDVGEAESYRRYWKNDWGIGDPEWIVAEDPDGWDENYPVKFWRPRWRQIMEKSIDAIVSDGYDGIYLDWIEVYSFPPVERAAESEEIDSKKEIVKFISDIAAYARLKKPGFIVVVQNAAELGKIKKYRDAADAVSQEAIWYDGGGDPDESEKVGDVTVEKELTAEYLTNLKIWIENGKPVFNVEYATDLSKANRTYRLGKKHGFITYVGVRQLDRLSDTPPNEP